MPLLLLVPPLLLLLLLTPALSLSASASAAVAGPPADDAFRLPQPRELRVNDTLVSGSSSSTGDGGFTPEQPTYDDSSSTGSIALPVMSRAGIWSYRCCPQCAQSCGGYFVKRICLNRTTSIQIDQYHCSRLPAVPVDSYIDWAMANCSRDGCSTWDWDEKSYNEPTLTCGDSFAWPQARCQFENATVADGQCWPARRPPPKLVSQAACGDTIPLLPFQTAAAIAPFAPRQFFDVSPLNQTLFVIGGWTSAGASQQSNPVEVWKSDNFGANWASVHVRTTAFTTIQDHTVETVGSSLIVIGGTSLVDNQPSPNIWRSDNLGVDWYLTGYLTNGRTQHDSCAFLRGIVIVGGLSASNIKNDVLYSVDAAHWYVQTASAPWAPRTYPSIDVVQDSLVLVGGWLQTGFAAVDVWKTYDMVTWQMVIPSTPWSARVGFVFYATHRQLVLLGGISESGQQYYQDQWISGDVGATWQLRSAKASIEANLMTTSGDGSTSTPIVAKPLSMRAWSAYTKMEGDRIFVMGGEYQRRLLNDVWLGDRSLQSTVAAAVPSSAKSSSGVSTGLLAIIVCSVIGGLFFLAVSIVIVRHARLKKREKEARFQQQAAESVALQQVVLRVSDPAAGGGVAHVGSPRSRPGTPVAVGAREAQGLISPGVASRSVVSPQPGQPAPSHSQRNSSSSVLAAPSGISGLPGVSPSPSLAPQRSRTPSSGGRLGRQSSGGSVAGPSGLARGSNSSGVASSSALKRSRKPSAGSSASASAGSGSTKNSGSSTPRSAGLTPRKEEDSTSPPVVGLQSSSSSSSAASLRPLLLPSSPTAVVPLVTPPPPFQVDPNHLAWMQAQISYQASILAAKVVEAQQQQQHQQAAASSASPNGVGLMARAMQQEPEEYFCSVPQLAPHQAQLLYVAPPSAAAAAAASSLPLPPETWSSLSDAELGGSHAEGHPAASHPHVISGEEELEPGQQRVEKASGEASSVDPARHAVQSAPGDAGSGSGSGNNTSRQRVHLHLEDIQEGQQGEESPCANPRRMMVEGV